MVDFFMGNVAKYAINTWILRVLGMKYYPALWRLFHKPLRIPVKQPGPGVFFSWLMVIPVTFGGGFWLWIMHAWHIRG